MLSLYRWKTPAKSANVQFHPTPRDLAAILASQSIATAPTVLHFFNKACPGCKAMHPKLQQIMKHNSDFNFHQVWHTFHHSRPGHKHASGCLVPGKLATGVKEQIVLRAIATSSVMTSSFSSIRRSGLFFFVHLHGR